MATIIGWLERHARTTLLGAGVLLTAGLLLTTLHLLPLGWSVYMAGHLLAIVGFLAVGSVNRRRMDGWAWAGLLVVVAGLILALPQLYDIWYAYVVDGWDWSIIAPVESPPIGLAAEWTIWIGVAWYALAAYGARALSGVAMVLFVEAAIIGLAVALGAFSPLVWIVAMLLTALGLLWLGASTTAPETTADPAAEAPAPLSA